MAKYYSLSNATFVNDFKAALESYYGDGVTIESASGTTIIFQCLSVCDKVLKFASYSAGVDAYVGDTSASMTQFGSPYNNEVGGNYNLILADTFIIIDSLSSSDCRNSVLVAKLTNGRYMVSSGTVTSNTGDSYRNHHCYFTDTMVRRPIRMIAPYAQTLKSNGKLCLFPSYIADDTEVELNADGTFASIQGLLLASTTGKSIVGANYYLSQSGLWGRQVDGTYCHTQKYVELEME